MRSHSDRTTQVGYHSPRWPPGSPSPGTSSLSHRRPSEGDCPFAGTGAVQLCWPSRWASAQLFSPATARFGTTVPDDCTPARTHVLSDEHDCGGIPTAHSHLREPPRTGRSWSCWPARAAACSPANSCPDGSPSSGRSCRSESPWARSETPSTSMATASRLRSSCSFCGQQHRSWVCSSSASREAGGSRPDRQPADEDLVGL